MQKEDLTDFIPLFRKSFIYVNNLHNKIIVIAINSYLIENIQFKQLMQDILLLNSLGIRIVLTYGVSSFLSKDNFLSNENGDISVVDENKINEIINICGAIRFKIESFLSSGMPNSSFNKTKLKVISGNFVYAKAVGVIKGVDMKFCGDIRKIDVESIHNNLSQNNIVLISPLGYSLSGLIYSVPMPKLSSYIASSLKAEKLIFLTRADGILDNLGQVINSISFDSISKIDFNIQHEDVINIFSSIIESLKNDINRVQLVSGCKDGGLLKELFTMKGSGTSFAKNSFVNIRQGLISDVPVILQLINPLIEKGILLDRDKNYLEKNINNFYVLEYDKIVYGCVSIGYIESNILELGCLVISKESQQSGYGKLLLDFVINLAKSKGVNNIITFTTQTKEWFLERGFLETSTDILPKNRLQEYLDSKRNSKILVLNLLD